MAFSDPRVGDDWKQCEAGNSYGAQFIGGDARVINGNVSLVSIIKRRSTLDPSPRSAILEWLSPLTFRRTHEEIWKKAVHQDDSLESRNSGDFSGKWFLESDIFDSWISRDIRKLWVYGMPGAGKTVLASIIIEFLLDNVKRLPKTPKTTKVAYLYLSYKEPYPIEHLLGSIVRQIVQDDETLPERLVNDFETHKRRGNEPPTLRDLSILLAEISDRSSVYIVIDGLDECPRETRGRLVEHIQPPSFKSLQLNLLIMSRLLDEFQKLANGFESLGIQAQNRDIDLFIDCEFRRNADLEEFAQQDPYLQDDIRSTIRAKCDGMFLLAKIHIGLLSVQLTVAEVRQYLKELPTNLDATYDLALSRILEQTPERKKLAVDTFGWILHSRSRLTLPELQHALAINSKTRVFDAQRIVPGNKIRDMCGGLVSVAQSGVSFVHYTAQTYFATRAGHLFGDVHVSMAETCAIYLCMPALDQPDDPISGISYADDLYDDPRRDLSTYELQALYSHDSDDQPSAHLKPRTNPSPDRSPPRLSFRLKMEKYPLASYAVRHLGYHLRKFQSRSTSDALLPTLKKLFQSRAKRNFFCRMLWSIQRYKSHFENDGRENHVTFEFYPDSTPSEIGFGGDDASEMSDSGDQEAQYLLEMILEKIKENVAEEQSDESVAIDEAEKIVAEDIDEETLVATERPTSEREISPLHLAAFLGWQPLLQSLIVEGPALDGLDHNGRSPIDIAVEQGHIEAVTVLLEGGAELNLASKASQGAVLQAAQRGNFNVVRMAISRSHKPLLNNDTGLTEEETSLPHTDRSRLLHLILLLIALLSQIFKKPQIPTESGEVADSINQEREDRPKSEQHNLGLLRAVSDGDLGAIEHLLSQDDNMCVERGLHISKVSMFLAVELGHVDIVKAFLDAKLDINCTDTNGNTPLHRASLRKDLEMIRMLLRYKPTIDKKNYTGNTPWSLVMQNHQTLSQAQPVLKALLQAGANPHITDGTGCSALYSMAAGGNVEVVRYLLDLGVDPSWQTIYGWSSLHWAAGNGKLECVRLLLAANASLSPLSDTSRTPLDMAMQRGQDLIARILKDAGAKTAQELVLANRPTRFRSSLNDIDWSSDHDRTDDAIGSPAPSESESTEDSQWQTVTGDVQEDLPASSTPVETALQQSGEENECPSDGSQRSKIGENGEESMGEEDEEKRISTAPDYDSPHGSDSDDEESSNDPELLDLDDVKAFLNDAEALIMYLERETVLTPQRKRKVIEFLLRDATDVFGQLIDEGDRPIQITEDAQGYWSDIVVRWKSMAYINELLNQVIEEEKL